ncbi:MAG: M56 family metallopeptidase [Acetatifactor sp.]|nr:M56 family metallopeptidase [Acetatifactor sp.]
MITALFLNVIAISISTSLIIIFLLIFAPFLNKRYAVKWKYLIWVVIAVRLIIPFSIDIPIPQIVLDVPAEITAPIGTNNENDAPSMSPAEPKPIEANNGNAGKAPIQAERKPLKLTLLDIAAYIWLTGCLLFLSVHIFSFLHFKGRITKKGMVVKERYILRQVCELSGKLRVKPNIRILRYEDAESPMVIGFLKPVLVLPNCDYSEEELFFVLKHELIHIKRHDIYFKLLFVTANALHWFNPLIYIMQKEAVVDMELSCDEKVIRQTAYDVRKAYTETLLSTFNKQHKKGTFLTTQFYGGKKIMKKRFKNILTRSPKKNGVLLCICAVCIVLISGMLIGCSVINNDSPEESGQTDLDNTNPNLDDNSNTQADSPDDSGTDISGDAQNENTEDPSEQSLGSEEKSYKSVLLGESNFRNRSGLVDESLNISEIKRAVGDDDDDVVVRVLKFAVVDLDEDEEEEVVLWIQVGHNDYWGFEILHYLNGEIYGYPIWYRSFMDLKTDGTFSISYSAADQGVGRMTFSENGYSISEAYTYTTFLGDGEYTVEYFVDNEPCSMDDYFDVVEGQDQKADVEWYDFSEDNINAVLQ